MSRTNQNFHLKRPTRKSARVQSNVVSKNSFAIQVIALVTTYGSRVNLLALRITVSFRPLFGAFAALQVSTYSQQKAQQDTK